MMILFDVIITLVEALFLLIPLIKVKDIKSKNKILILYLGIFISIIVGSLLLDRSIFKYFAMPLLIFCIMKILIKDTMFHDFFFVMTEFLFKIILEYICYLIFFNWLDYIYFVIIMEIICLVSVVILNKFISKIYNNIFNKWNSRHKFYIRYILLIIFNCFILFLIYNLLIMKEVL